MLVRLHLRTGRGVPVRIPRVIWVGVPRGLMYPDSSIPYTAGAPASGNDTQIHSMKWQEVP